MSWLDRGWQVFEAEPRLDAWLETAGPAALVASQDAEARAAWLRHRKTWFVGVDVLPNDATGAVGNGLPLAGKAKDTAEAVTGQLALHRGQVSVTYPGYPAQDEGETDAAHRFRRNRDAAHLDGLLPIGPEKRRFLKESHGYILGVAVTNAAPEAAPLVVWEGSHRIIRGALAKALDVHAPEAWGDIDLTDVYQNARRVVFDTCPRREVPLAPGQAVLVHRHAIHGVATWRDGAKAAPEGRVIVYFRPELANPKDWLALP